MASIDWPTESDESMRTLRPTMTINGRRVAFTSGSTIFDVATAADLIIPTLCEWHQLGHDGVCRICVVSVKGSDELLPACSTEALPGMEVRTDSDAVISSRKYTLESMLASHRNDCLTCESSGNCRLQDLAYDYGVKAGGKLVPLDVPSAPESPFITRDYTKCIKCASCVVACSLVQGHKAIAYPEGEWDSRAALDGWYPLQDEKICVDCGQCVEECPVGALTEKKAEQEARTWETETTRTTCPYCGVGCQQVVHTKRGRITKVTAAIGGKPNLGRLCVKGRFAYDFLYSEERLKTPLIKEDGVFREASWDEALDLVARRLGEIREKYGPDSIAGVSCARALNEDSYNMQKLFRSVLGTNNIDQCART
jgi:predicted molibdopterin-dependent oxidoreductase YjgC